MIAVAVAALDFAYLAWALEDSRRSHCGNSVVQAFALNLLVLAAYAVWLFGRCLGGPR
jgi:hypothetical protein